MANVNDKPSTTKETFFLASHIDSQYHQGSDENNAVASSLPPVNDFDSNTGNQEEAGKARETSLFREDPRFTSSPTTTVAEAKGKPLHMSPEKHHNQVVVENTEFADQKLCVADKIGPRPWWVSRHTLSLSGFELTMIITSFVPMAGEYAASAALSESEDLSFTERLGCDIYAISTSPVKIRRGLHY
eukprot:scaffold1071_cov166-Amphora_coffeaeformis.AAC.5